MSSQQPPVPQPLSSSSSSGDPLSYYLTSDGILIDQHRSTNDSKELIHNMIRDKNWSLLRHMFHMPSWTKNCPKMLSQQDRDGRTPLHIFCRMTDQFIVQDEDTTTKKKRTLSKIDNSDDNHEDQHMNSNEGTSSMEEVTSSNNNNDNRVDQNNDNTKEPLPMDIAKGLMHVESLFIKDEGGENILHGLCGRGDSSHVVLVREILRFADCSSGRGARRLISDTNEYGLTPLHFVSDGSTPIETVRLMLQYCGSSSQGPNSNHCTINTKQAPAAASSSQNINEQVAIVVPEVESMSTMKATPPQPTTYTFTTSSKSTLHRSVSKSPLLSRAIGPHPLSLQDFDGDACLHFACSGGGDVELLRELCQHWPQATLVKNKEQQFPIQDFMDYWRDESRLMLKHALSKFLEETYDTILKRSNRGNRDDNTYNNVSSKHQEQSTERGDTPTSNNHTGDDENDQNSDNHVDEMFISRLWDSACILLQAAYQVKEREENGSNTLGLAELIAVQESKAVRPFFAAVAISEFPRDVFLLALVACRDSLEDETKAFDPNTGMLPLHVATSLRMTNNITKEHGDVLFKIKTLLLWYPEAATIYTQGDHRCQRLPLMLAIMHNHPMEHVRALLDAAPQTIRSQERSGGLSSNPTKHFYPFMMAAVGNNNSLSVVYELLLRDPTILSSFY